MYMFIYINIYICIYDATLCKRVQSDDGMSNVRQYHNRAELKCLPVPPQMQLSCRQYETSNTRCKCCSNRRGK